MPPWRWPGSLRPALLTLFLLAASTSSIGPFSLLHLGNVPCPPFPPHTVVTEQHTQLLSSCLSHVLPRPLSSPQPGPCFPNGSGVLLLPLVQRPRSCLSQRWRSPHPVTRLPGTCPCLQPSMGWPRLRPCTQAPGCCSLTTCVSTWFPSVLRPPRRSLPEDLLLTHPAPPAAAAGRRAASVPGPCLVCGGQQALEGALACELCASGLGSVWRVSLRAKDNYKHCSFL